MLAREPAEMTTGFGVVTAGNDFDGRAAAFTKRAEQARELAGGEPVTRRVRDHCSTAGAAYPAHRVGERRPATGYVSGFAARQEIFECLLHIARVAALDQKTCEVRARQNRAARVACRALEGAKNAFLCQPPLNFLRAPM